MPDAGPSDPEAALYARLATEHGDAAHGRYNALRRRVVSFARAYAALARAWASIAVREPVDAPRLARVLDAFGRAAVHHFDLYAQALAKVERGHRRDLDDVRAMVARGLVAPAAARRYFLQIEPELYRFPAVDPPAFRAAVADAFGGPPPSGPGPNAPPGEPGRGAC